MKIDYSIFRDRIQNVRLLTWGYFAFHLFSMWCVRLFLNSDSIFVRFDFWFWIFALEHALIFGFYAVVKPFIKKYTIALVIGSTMLIGFFRTVITTGLANYANVGPQFEWGFQLITGALFEVSVVVVWANVNGAYRDHRALVDELNETRNQVLGYRENAEVILAEEQEKLQEITRASLLPQLGLIEKAVSQRNLIESYRWSVAQELKALIHNQVRPLSESLSQAAKAIVQPVANTPNHFFTVVALPKHFRVTNSTFPTVTYLLMLLSFGAAPFWILDNSWIAISLGSSVFYWLVLSGIKWVTQNWPPLRNYVGVLVLLIISVVPVLPSYAIAVWLYPDTSKAVLYGLTITSASVILFMSLALLDSLDYGSRAYRELLEEENRELSHEMALFEQQLWAARKSWSLVIHGTVQAALTAALTRLNAGDADAKTLALAKKDLVRAIDALNNSQVAQIKFAPALKELVATWQGVCDIEVQLSLALKKIIATDARLSMCLNEILKEAISNAVRHGDARTASISLTQTDQGVLRVSVLNDGQRPKPSKRKGLGSALLDEVTLDWRLGFDEKIYQTVLVAHLPFSRVQA